MELLKSHFFKMRKAYIESFIILLFLSCCPFIVSSCHEEEKEEISDSPFDEEDIQHEQDLNAYLGKTYYNRQIKKFPTEKQNVSLKHILT